MKKPYIGRIVTVITAICTLGLGIAPVLADMDLESTIGVATGIAGLSAVVVKWLDGLQKHEERSGL